MNGNSWAVTFSSSLGDQPALIAAPTRFLSTGTQLSVVDNLVRGDSPTSHLLSGLGTGVQYGVRLQAFTRGYNRGYGPLSPDSAQTKGVPAGPPPALRDFAAYDTLQVV